MQQQIKVTKGKIDEGGGADQKRQSDQGRVLQQRHDKAQAEHRSADKEEDTIKEQLRLAAHRVRKLEFSAKVVEKNVAEKRLAVKEVAEEVILFHDDAPADEDVAGHALADKCRGK